MHRVPGKHWWSTLAGGAIGFSVVVVPGLTRSSFSGEPSTPARLGRAASVGRWPDSGQRLPRSTPDFSYAGSTVRRILTRRGPVVRRYSRTGRTLLFVAVATLAQVKAGPRLRGGVSRSTTLRTKISGSGAQLAVNGEFFHLGQDGSPIASVWPSIPVSTAAGIVDAQSYNSDYLRPHQPVREFVLSNDRVHSVNRRLTKIAIPHPRGSVIQYTHSADGRNRYIPNGFGIWPR